MRSTALFPSRVTGTVLQVSGDRVLVEWLSADGSVRREWLDKRELQKTKAS
jgi:hypothetical protein